MKEYISIKMACEIAQVSRWTLHRLVASGHVQAVRFDKDKSSPIYIDADSLQAFLAEKAEM